MNHLTIALDVMGGDFGPRVTIPAVAKALEYNPSLSFLLFGDLNQAQPFLNTLSHDQQQRIQFQHTEKWIDNDTPAIQAIRHSKETSMRLALEAVATGKAQACVSGGNTGALMGLSKQLIAPLPRIHRPALTSLIPTMGGNSGVMLDLGANVEADEQLLLQFAEMGNVFAQTMLGIVYPRLALLNIGSEAHKGTAEIRRTHQQLSLRYDLNYIGFIEGDKLMNNVADVIVCDGFSGNIALKSLEGMAKNILTLLRQSNHDSHICHRIRHSLLRLILRRSLRRLQQINPDRHNGATMLGLSQVVVKSHGGAGVNAYYYAIEYAFNQIKHQIPQKLESYLANR
ncbi:MAG: phosphate acyltransferase PlsX [Lonepinella koalarum]|nr:phosphate acyltransferase PlsX [Lonepinella koalarum]